MRQLASTARRIRAARRSGADRSRRWARTRSTARTASAASWSRPTCAAAISARSSPKLQQRIAARSRIAAGLLARLRRHVRAADPASAAAGDRRAADAAADLRPAVCWRSARGNDALIVFSGVPLALTGGVVALWLRGHSAVDLGRRRLHRAVRRRGAQRPRDGVVHPRAARSEACRSTRRSRRAR